MDGKLDLLADNFCGAFEPLVPGRAGSFSVSIWRTTDGCWGARFGIGEHRIDPVLQLAVHAAISSHQAEKLVRDQRASATETPSE